jgi:DNA-binding MarR family transcriptional regulator
VNNSEHETNPLERRDVDELLLQFDALLYRLARAVGPHMESAGGHLPAPQYMVLKALEDDGPLRVSAVADHLGVGNPAASMLVHALCEADLVDRTTDPSDRRATLLEVSEVGHERLRSAERDRRRFMERVTAKLSRDEMEALIRGLDTIVETMAEQEGRTTPAE